MIKQFLLVFALLSFPVSASAFDTAKHPFGLGIQLGDPTAITAKYYLDRNWAIQGGLGSLYWSGLGIYADLLYTLPDAVKTNTKAFTLPVFFGAGAKVGGHMVCPLVRFNNRDGCYLDPYFGVRIPVGAAIHLAETPLELQLEIAPEVGYFHLGLDAGLALRYYF